MSRCSVTLLALALVAAIGCDGDDITGPAAAPQVAITLPADSTRVLEGADCIFAVSANSSDGGRIDSLVWYSSQDGRLGVGASRVVRDLSPDWHDISVFAFDHEGATGSDTISVRVLTLPEPTVSAPTDGAEFEFGETVEFEGAAADRDGGDWLLAWRSSRDGPLGAGPNVTRNDLAAGEHTIWLVALDDEGQLDSTSVAITVGEPRTGDLQVFTSTTLSDGTDTSLDLDPDGYVVIVDVSSNRPIANDGVVTFSDLAAGQHVVELAELAPHCDVDPAEPNPRRILVTSSSTALTGFTVRCEEVGALEVATITTGENPDPDGYVVVVDGSLGQPINVNDTIRFEGVVVGGREVTLTSLSSNCSVGSGNPQTVDVRFGEIVSHTFEVVCQGQPRVETGNLEVAVSTTTDPGGSLGLDPDGYWVVVDGIEFRRIAVNGEQVSFEDLVIGTHFVYVRDVASNCGVSANPQSVDVTSSGANLSLAVKCANHGLDFDGNEYGRTRDADDLDLTKTWTLEMWVNPSSGARDTVQLLSKGGADSVGSFQLGIKEGKLLLDTRAGQADSSFLSSTELLNDGRWQHVAAVFDDGQARLYIDGREVAAGGGMAMPQVTAQPLALARALSSEPKYYKGRIDDVRIWNVARTAEQIRDNSNVRLKGDEAGLVAYWPMNEGMGGSAQDATRKGHALVLTNSPTWVPGKP
ncbi:MAG: hypothetical protein JSU87_14165 [Gemmatimonadota bacterium]|nr:MAG: hypothetical protein JSU87_14165 [Gemmatimonadota bacterium]